MNYIEIIFHDIPELQQEILSSRLAETGFESFVQEENELHAFVPDHLYDPGHMKEILAGHPFRYTEVRIPDRNWNEEWERNFHAVEIAGKCIVRAPFHEPSPGFQYEIVIEPKMSFGTAHHETTSQMIGLMLAMDMKGKRVLDMGCGTGILAILAEKMGATGVLAVDNDEWAFRNTIENLDKNACTKIVANFGGIEVVSGVFDIILANITRNILLEQIPHYCRMLAEHGQLLMSGFYNSDLPVVREAALAAGFQSEDYTTDNGWVAARFVK